MDNGNFRCASENMNNPQRSAPSTVKQGVFFSLSAQHQTQRPAQVVWNLIENAEDDWKKHLEASQTQVIHAINTAEKYNLTAL